MLVLEAQDHQPGMDQTPRQPLQPEGLAVFPQQPPAVSPIEAEGQPGLGQAAFQRADAAPCDGDPAQGLPPQPEIRQEQTEEGPQVNQDVDGQQPRGGPPRNDNGGFQGPIGGGPGPAFFATQRAGACSGPTGGRLRWGRIIFPRSRSSPLGKGKPVHCLIVHCVKRARAARSDPCFAGPSPAFEIMDVLSDNNAMPPDRKAKQ